MRTLRIAVALAGLAAVIVPGPIGRAGTAPKALAGTTIIAADGSTWMPVTLPRPVTISRKPFDNPVITLLSGGPLTAIVLRQDVARGVEVVYTHADLCRPGCSGEPLSSFQVWDHSEEKPGPKVTLPAGRYQLYAVGIDAPTTVRIELPGLQGRTRLAPTRPAAVTTKDITGDTPPGPYSYTAEVDHTVNARGLSLVAAEVDTDYFAASNFSSCIEPADGETPPGVDESSCQRASSAAGVVARHTAEGGRKVVMSMGLLGRGAYSHGLKLRQLSVVRSFHARHLLLNYATTDRYPGWLYSLSSMW